MRVAHLIVVASLSCVQEGGGVQGLPRPVPTADGDRVISYDVDVVEDDSDCGAATPIKSSTEDLTVEWHTNRDITTYARGGAYTADIRLDGEGRYARDGTNGPCRDGSKITGRMDKDTGENRVLCRKQECDVIINSFARRHVDHPDGGPVDGSAPRD